MTLRLCYKIVRDSTLFFSLIRKPLALWRLDRSFRIAHRSESIDACDRDEFFAGSLTHRRSVILIVVATFRPSRSIQPFWYALSRDAILMNKRNVVCRRRLDRRERVRRHRSRTTRSRSKQMESSSKRISYRRRSHCRSRDSNFTRRNRESRRQTSSSMS